MDIVGKTQGEFFSHVEDIVLGLSTYSEKHHCRQISSQSLPVAERVVIDCKKY